MAPDISAGLAFLYLKYNRRRSRRASRLRQRWARLRLPAWQSREGIDVSMMDEGDTPGMLASHLGNAVLIRGIRDVT